MSDRARELLGEAQVLLEDNHVLALAKPAGLLTQAAEPGDDNLLDRARAYVKERYDKPGNVFLGLVHRLDRNVSGVVLLARTSKAAARLSEAFRARRVDKVYLAVVEGESPPAGELVHRLREREGERGVEVAEDGAEAVLRFERLAVAGGRSLLRVHLLTGRKHQIRAQLAAAGHPVTGDPLYGRPSPVLRRPALHAFGLSLDHPVRSERIRVVAPLPPDLEALVSRFGAGSIDAGI